MTKTFDPAAVAISAIENVSRIPVTKGDIKRMLATGTGEPSHVMALFSDVDYSSILRLAIAFDISDAGLACAYVRARDTYAASNAEMDEFVREMEAVTRSSNSSAGRKAPNRGLRSRRNRSSTCRDPNQSNLVGAQLVTLGHSIVDQVVRRSGTYLCRCRSRTRGKRRNIEAPTRGFASHRAIKPEIVPRHPGRRETFLETAANGLSV